MCGIAGFVGGFVRDLATRMNEAQAHRGPDGQGVFEDPDAGVALGHVRLSILDLSDAAAQPMISRNGRFVLSYNGEIYNFEELRRDIEADGVRFRSTGDTEVLLAGLERDGEAFIDRLNGMFAFALWDRHHRTLRLAVDHLGIKPLYYAEPVPGTLLFASEIKAMCAHPDLAREPDFIAIQEHLAFCHTSGDRTALRGVRRLRPGCLLTWKDGRTRIRRHWQPGFGADPDADRDDVIRWLRDEIPAAVGRQMVSDVPVGASLSGGLDSSIIAIDATTHVGRSFRVYTITYPQDQNRFDRQPEDTPYAREIASHLGLTLEEIEIRPEVASLWPMLIHHLDEPIADPAAIACYLIARLAREDGTPVLLSGQGADELFAGYPRYWAMSAAAPLGHLPAWTRRILAAGGRLLPGAKEGAGGAFLRRVRRVLTEIARGPDERFLALCAGAPEREIRRILSPETRAALGDRGPFETCRDQMSECGLPAVDRYLERDLTVYLPNHNLLYTDKCGMAAGIEARVPLLDRALVEGIVGLPAEFKFAHGTTKVLLREAVRDRVPEAIIARPKAGFGAPYRHWLRHDLQEMWDDLTAESLVRSRGWFDPEALREARRRSQQGRVDLYLLQWAVLTIELWAQQFLDRDPAAPSTSLVPEAVELDGARIPTPR